MPSQLFRHAILSRMRVVSPTSGSSSSPTVSPAQPKQKRPSCATSNKFSKERLERLAQQKAEQAPASPAFPVPTASTFTSNKSHIIRSMSKLFGRSRSEPESEPLRGRPRQRRVVSGGSLDDCKRGRASSPPRGSRTGTKIAAPRRFPSAPKASPAAGQMPIVKAKRGPSPLSQSSWTSPAESVPRTPPAPVGMPSAVSVATVAELEEKVDTPMDWEATLPLPPLITRSLTSSTDSSDSASLPQTPIDEDVVMVDVFENDSSESDDNSDNAPEDKPTKSIPLPALPADDPEPGVIIASDSELERQLWADMNDILGHEDEPARFCGPYAEQVGPTLADLPAGVPPPIVAQDIAFPFVSNGQSAKTIPEVVVTPATPHMPVGMSSMDALWEELFGPEC